MDMDLNTDKETDTDSPGHGHCSLWGVHVHVHARVNVYVHHRWAISPISVISDIKLSLISEPPISDWESRVRHYIRYRNKVLSNIQHPNYDRQAALLSGIALAHLRWGVGLNPLIGIIFFFNVGYWNELWCRYRGTLLISERHFSVWHICLQYQNNRCRCRISPTLRSMLMPIYDAHSHVHIFVCACVHVHVTS